MAVKSSLYKLEIIIIKVLPFIIAALYILSTFDNYVREGKIPRGKHEIGFKELR